MDMLWRLTWALPFTVLSGSGVILLLKRILGQRPLTGRAVQRMVRRESLSVSDDTRVHLIEVDGQSYVLVESARSISFHDAQAVPQAPGTRGVRSAAWLRSLRGGVSQ